MHRLARGRVVGVLSGGDEIVVPTLFAVEVAASLARIGVPLSAIRSYVDRLLDGARVIPLGPRAARQARETAMRWKLRAAGGRRMHGHRTIGWRGEERPNHSVPWRWRIAVSTDLWIAYVGPFCVAPAPKVHVSGSPPRRNVAAFTRRQTTGAQLVAAVRRAI